MDNPNQNLVQRIEHIQSEVEKLKGDLIAQGLSISKLQDTTFASLFGTQGDEGSREKSAMGRFQKIQIELENLKNAQAAMEKAQTKEQQTRERYVTGAILAALGTGVGWAMTRILGGG